MKNMPVNDFFGEEEGTIESEEFFRRLDEIYQQPDHLMYHKLDLVTSLVRPGGRLLDIGCGTGEAIARLQDRFEYIVGVDASAEAAKYAHKKVGDRDNVKLIRSSALRSCFQAEAFDCCLILDVLEHLEQPELVLSQAARVLKQDGQLIVTMPNWTDWIFSGLLKLNPEHRTFNTPRGWKQLIERCGFDVSYYRAVRLPFLQGDIWGKKLPYLGMCIVFNAERLAVE